MISWRAKWRRRSDKCRPLTRFRSPEHYHNHVLLGDAGNDLIHGGLGHGLLIGGLSADTLHGRPGDGLLVGNGTAHDSNLAALLALLAEWGRTDLDERGVQA